MTVQRIRCAHFDIKSNREMAYARAGHCPKTLEYGQYISALKLRECRHFERAPDDPGLIEWAAKRPIWNEERPS